MTSAHKKIEISQCASVELVNEVAGEREFSTTNHVISFREERSEGQKVCDEANKIKLSETIQGRPKIKCIILISAKKWVPGLWHAIPQNSYSSIGHEISWFSFYPL